MRYLHQPATMPPWVPTGLLRHVQWQLQQWGWAVEVRDHRLRPEEGMPEPVRIPLRDYQRQAVELGHQVGYGVFDMPPRSGKTRTMLELQRRLALPTVWIAPTDGIVRQTVEVADQFFGKGYARQQQGASGWEKLRHRQIVVCTAATAVRLPAEFYYTRQVVVVDEWHHGAAKSYHTIFAHCAHVYHRYGMTGTFYRSGGDALAMHALLSNTLLRVETQDLVAQGFLVPTSVAFLPVHTQRLPSSMKNFITEHGKWGIHENAERNMLVARVARQLYALGKRVLVLVGTKAQGRMIGDALRDVLPRAPSGCEFETAEFVYSGRQREVIGRVLHAFDAGQEVKVLIGTSLIGEGIDIPTADALVYARGESAAVTLRQYGYRVNTAVPGKDRALIVDFADGHHPKLHEHAQERLRLYWEEPTFDIRVLGDETEIKIWAGCPSQAASGSI